MANMHTFDLNFIVDYPIVSASQGSLNSAWVQPFADGAGGDRAVYMLVLGDTAQNLDMKLTQAVNSSGGSAKDITGAAITTITSSTDQKIVTIEIGPGALDDPNLFNYVRAEITIASSGVGIWGLVYLRYRLRTPGIQTQPSAYAQAVRVY